MAKRRSTDPNAALEAAKYAKPIPSREFILDALTHADGPLTHEQVARVLKLVDEDDLEALRRRLRAMERDGQIMSNRRGAYGLVQRLDLVRGRVQAHRDGYGFVVPDEGGEDLYINARQMSKVFDGDEVLCRLGGLDRRGKREAVIVEVLKRALTKVVGRLQFEGGAVFVVPDNPRIQHDILIPPVDTLGAQAGQYVVAAITGAPGVRAHPTGKVVEVLGEHLAPGMEIEVAIRSHDIPHEWPAAVLREADALDPEPAAADKQGRVDVRHLPFVTIDGEDARDFDDAVYCETRRGGGWQLWVAIADVSHYVAVGSALDQEASLRGNSVYFPERVIPMLPEALSNGLCSLKPEVDRLCMVCEMSISRAGNITDYRFYEGVMHSKARLTYNKVAAMLDEADERCAELRQRYKPLVPHLQNLHALYHCLRAARDKRGAIDFETTETRIVFGADRKIETIVPVVRNDAHKLIEECMLCANVATAEFLQEQALPALYRVHRGPTPQKLETLRAFLGELGLWLGGGDNPTPADYQELLSQVTERADAAVIQTMLLRSLSQAVYQPDNEGHFGLHYTAYAHFTSPIRRYPDLLVHRALRQVIRSRRQSKRVERVKGVQPLSPAQIYPYDEGALVGLGIQCSMSERRADEATREVVAWLKCEYLQDRVGEQFDGVVTAVTAFGLFVELTDVYVEGLVHVSALSNDYYHFDAARQRLLGERSRQSYQLGDRVRVQVARVSLDDKKIDLELMQRLGGPQGAKKAARKDADRAPAQAASARLKERAPSPVSAIAARAGKKLRSIVNQLSGGKKSAAKTSPSKTSPAKPSSSGVSPYKTSPAKAAPSKAAPPRAAQPKASSSKASSSKTSPSRTSSSKASPSKVRGGAGRGRARRPGRQK